MSFHDNVFERAKIEEAMDLIVSNPVLVLDSISAELVEQQEPI